MHLLIKDVSEAVYEQLSSRARRSRRSPDEEARVLLETALGCRPSVEEELAAIDALRNSLRVPPLTDDFLAAAIDDGRP